MTYELNEAFINHCGPVILKKKPAAMMPLSHQACKEIMHMSLAQYGLKAEVLEHRNFNDLVIVYRPALLKETLENETAKSTLSSFGYPIGTYNTQMTAYLKKRIKISGGFPHEVGFFLGYPVEDVLGFIEHGGHFCKYCGKWKVYGDVNLAKSMFEQYDRCKNFLVNYVNNGGSLTSLCLAIAG